MERRPSVAPLALLRLVIGVGLCRFGYSSRITRQSISQDLVICVWICVIVVVALLLQLLLSCLRFIAKVGLLTIREDLLLLGMLLRLPLLGGSKVGHFSIG